MDILIIKIGALGDVVRSSFIAQALKEKYQNQKPQIFWITDQKAFPLFDNNPYVDHIISKEDKEKLKDKKFDLVVNLEEDEENCQFVSLLKFKELVGFFYDKGRIIPTPSAKEWFDMSALGEKPKNNLLKKNNKKTHRQIMAEIIGVNFKKYEPFLRLNDQQRNFAKDSLRRYSLSRSDLIIGINTGSADRWPKQLSIEKTAKLIEVLEERFNAQILLFGGPNEIERNKEIMKRSKAHIINTGCGNDLFEFPALISICSIFISTDSLGLHIALALKRKTIALIGPTSYSEIDMYGLGEKVIAKSNCVCCFKKDCKSMEKINIPEIAQKVEKLLLQKITILITAFKEPNINKSIESIINQKTKHQYEIIVSAPDKETLDIVRKYSKQYKNIRSFQDPGKGKSYALNLIFKKIETDILILTDGDVFISDNSIDEIYNMFLDPEIGCLTGRPVPIEDRKTKYGYWANFLFDSAHKIREKTEEKNKFIECSGYLFAFRKKAIDSIPLDVAEDTVIPYYFWEKGYKIGYAKKAKVYVKNVNNWKDWINQKTRTSRGHETLGNYVNIQITPRVKTFSNESKGIFQIFTYPKSLKEVIWSLELIFARLFMWFSVFYQIKIKKHTKIDAWQRIESTKQ